MKTGLYIGNELAAALPEIIASATESLQLAMYQLSPEVSSSTARMRALWEQLNKAPQRGVKCHAVLHSGSRSLPGMESATRAAAQLQQAGWTVRLHESGKIMHAKALVIDGRHTLIGSHNWTETGLYSNHEVSSMRLDDPEAAQLAGWMLYRMTD